MGCSWYSPRSDHRSRGWRQSPTFRRVALYAADRAVPLFTNRRRSVELSDHASVLSALRGLHKIAAGSTNREAVPAPRGFLTPAALTSGALADAPLSLPPAGAPDARALSSGREPTTRSDAPSGARAHI